MKTFDVVTMRVATRVAVNVRQVIAAILTVNASTKEVSIFICTSKHFLHKSNPFLMCYFQVKAILVSYLRIRVHAGILFLDLLTILQLEDVRLSPTAAAKVTPITLRRNKIVKLAV